MDNFDLKKYLVEGRLIREEEQGYILYTTNVEYDNGKTGYMYQLVNSEDGEENEIGFDQLYFVGNGGDNDQQVFYGKNFKNVDMGSYQEEKVSKEQAIKLYKELTGGSDGKEDNPRENRLFEEDNSVAVEYLKNAFQTYLEGGDNFEGASGDIEIAVWDGEEYGDSENYDNADQFRATLQALTTSPISLQVPEYGKVTFKGKENDIIGSFIIPGQ